MSLLNNNAIRLFLNYYLSDATNLKFLHLIIKPKIMREIITIMIVTIGFISCSSDTDNTATNSGFVGKWNWTGTHGGFAFHIHDTPASTGTTYQLNLMNNNNFSILKNSVEVVTGKYEITTGQSIYTGEMGKYIICDMSNIPKGSYFVTQGIITVQDINKLSIDDNYNDGIGSGFKRI